MNKKNIIVITIASVIALIVAFCIAKPQNNIKQVESDNIQNIEREAVVKPVEENFILEENNQEKKDIILDKDIASKKNQNTSKKSVTSTKNTTEQIEEKEITTKFEATIKEEDIDYGIYKEEGTNNVVITKEFSSKSPKKYSFKGFGILDEITR